MKSKKKKEPKRLESKQRRYYCGDFETTVTGRTDQDYTEVWASALVEFNTEDVLILHSIEDTLEYIETFSWPAVIYYHNLKFDGQFWVDHLARNTDYQQAYYKISDYEYQWIDKKEMPKKSFKYVISDKGLWYSITIRTPKGYYIEIRDSLKLLPFSVEAIGKSFQTKHKKLNMEYIGDRFSGCEITEQEKEYIRNDVLVVKEALEIMFEEGHNKLTIGSCCLSEYKKTQDRVDYEWMFPDLYQMRFDQFDDLKDHDFGSESFGEYIRQSYKGGWCYVVEGKERTRFYNGVTADVNSLYPSMMHSESGNYYPIGKPQFFIGNVPDDLPADRYYFIRFRARFELKKNKLPCIQIKGSALYRANEWLKTSDGYNFQTGNYCRYYHDIDGTVKECKPVITVTMTDWKLIQEQYDLYDLEVLDGCWFYSMTGIFDTYIDKYRKQKQTSTGARRQLAKLFLNNLYGKMASNDLSSFKVAFISNIDGVVKYIPVEEHNKKPGYIPVGSAITSYARNFTIRAAQENYHGLSSPGFIYADTDSIHCDLPADQIKGIKIHPSDFCCWKLESGWEVGWYTRQKTYIEFVTSEDGKDLEEPYYCIKGAGIPAKSKRILDMALKHTQLTPDQRENMNVRVQAFIDKGMELEDYDVGLIIPSGNLRRKRVIGGIVLVDQEYEMRG